VIPKPSICIDIDNVITQTDRRIREIIREVTSNRVDYEYGDIVNFNYFDCTDKNGNRISREEWHLAHEIFSNSDVILSLKPIIGALRNIGILARKAEIHFVTSRLPSAQTSTAEWLHHNGIGDSKLHFCEHRTKHLLKQKFAAAVEDDYDQSLEFAKLGVPSFLLSHPWNENRESAPLVFWHRQWDTLGHSLLEIL
jgi:uncharacterized HAD superfamily protein